MNTILSLDASTNKTGWCIMTDGKYIESGIIDLHKDKDGEHRLCTMMKKIGLLIKEKHPSKVILEETTMSSNAKTLRILAQLGGFIKGYCFVKGITLEMIKEIDSRIEIDKAIMEKSKEGLKPKAPGMKYRHYAPKAKVTVIKGSRKNTVEKIKRRA